MGLSYLAKHLVKELISKEAFTCLKDESQEPYRVIRENREYFYLDIISKIAFAKHQFLNSFYEFLLFALANVAH